MPSYGASKVVVSATQQLSALVGGAAGSQVGCLFTAPFGPDVPVPNLSGQLLQSTYGAPTTAANLQYSGPLGLSILSGQAQTLRSAAPSILGMRVGVTRASVTVGGITLQGVGPYAGSRGNNLAVQYTVSGGFITSLTVVDTAQANAVVYTNTNAGQLSSWQNIYNTMANLSAITYPVVASAVTPATAYPGAAITAPGTSFTGGLDGQSATGADPSIATLLQQSLAYRADYLWAGFDAATVAPALLTHLSAAFAANNFRMAASGPAYGTSFSSLNGSYSTPFLSDRMQCVAHDWWQLPDPSQPGSTRTVDGFYAGAALIGLKASGQRRATCNKREPISGFTAFGNTGGPGVLTETQRDTLGGNGLVVFRQNQNSNAITIRDNITTTPEYPAGSNNVNIFYQASMRDVDNAALYALYQAVDPFAGQARLDVTSDVMRITNALQLAVNALTGPVINGLGPQGIQLQINPQTGIPQATVNMLYPFPYGEIDITPTVSIG